MAIPAWARGRIAREVEAYLARAVPHRDGSLDRAAEALTAWPVYADLDGVLIVGADGEVYRRDNATTEVGPEPDPGWRLLAWAAAAEEAPELRGLLPARPTGTPACAACGGAGRVQLTPASRAWCGGCWGLGWRPESGAGPIAPMDRG